MRKPRIGFIGLGTMGMPMAARLLEAGYPLTVFNRTQKKMLPLVAKGATGADSPKSVAVLSQVIITMLPDSPDVKEIILGKHGIIEGISQGKIVIDMSSILPSVAVHIAQALSEKGAEFLDAPVSGSTQGAERGTLSIMVGGEAKTLARAHPILGVLGNTIYHQGPVGTGQLAKLGNQIIVAALMAAYAAAIALVERGGGNSQSAITSWQGGLAHNRVLERKAEPMCTRTFPPAFRASLHLKDLKNIEGAVRALFPRMVKEPSSPLKMPHPELEFVLMLKRLYELLIAMGYADEDHSAIIRDFDL